MKYTCLDCNMAIDNLVCHSCKQPLKLNEIDLNGQKIKVAQCDKCEGMVKSPQCCGKDMDFT
jgi:NAD-dependent SIR2 family protein deacetylase